MGMLRLRERVGRPVRMRDGGEGSDFHGCRSCLVIEARQLVSVAAEMLDGVFQ